MVGKINYMEEEIEKIRDAYKQQRYSDCLVMAGDVLKIERGNINALSYKASSLLHLGLFQEAVNNFSDCLSLDNNLFHLWVLRGDAFYEMKEYEKAFSDYWISLQIEPNNGAVMDKIARTLFLIGDKNRALEYIEKAINIAESPEPLLIMITMLKKMGLHSFLHQYYDLGIARFPEEKVRFDKFLAMDLSE